MNYDEFRTLWHEALDAAGLLPYPLWPTETIDVHQMDRVYSLYVSLGGGHGAEPFYTTARLDHSTPLPGWNGTGLQRLPPASLRERRIC